MSVFKFTTALTITAACSASIKEAEPTPLDPAAPTSISEWTPVEPSSHAISALAESSLPGGNPLRNSNPHSEISSSPNEQVVTILERLDDPQDFMTALVTANSSGSLSSLALEQKAAIIKHALAIDPFQEYMRDLTEATDARPLLDIIRENGPLLLSEELENGHCEIFISDDLSTVLVDRSNQKIEILPTVVTESGALTFSSMNARGKTEIVGSVSANKHGLVISLTLPGEAPARGEYWRGKELSHYPYSIMPDVERILGLE